MNWISKRKKGLILTICIAALLICAFFYGGSTLNAQEISAETEKTEEQTGTAKPQKTEKPEKPEKDQPVSEEKPLPDEPQNVQQNDTQHECTVSISCATIADHMDWLNPDKADFVPPDGWLLQPVTVAFTEGESVFDVLLRVCRENGIHMEFEDTPIYQSAYIEGIGNLYEFDCGELSGWMYCVNGWFPNYGCSRYALNDGDEIKWVYTCDLGDDVGGGYATDN